MSATRMLRIVAAIMVVVTLACAPAATTRTSGPQSKGDRVTRTTLAALVASSDVIVVGRLDRTGGTRNLARLEADPTKEDPHYFLLGQDYEVSVELALKGSPGVRLTFTVPVGWGNASVFVPHPNYMPATVGGRYVLFLVHQIDGTSDYAMGPEPNRFLVTDRVRTESAWVDATNHFPATDLSQFISQIQTQIRK